MAGKIILDEIEKSSTGTGIKLNSPLLSNTGVQIISESGTLGSTITFPSTIDNTTLGSGVTFPAGHVIQMLHGYYDTATTIGNNFTKIIELSGTAKGNNSKFVAHWILVGGGVADAEGHRIRIHLESGGTSTGDTADVMQSGTSTTNAGNFYAYYEDVPGTGDAAGYSGGYSIRTISGTTTKQMNFNAGDVFSAGFWVLGDTTFYINRSKNRASHEGGITSFTLYEIAL